MKKIVAQIAYIALTGVMVFCHPGCDETNEDAPRPQEDTPDQRIAQIRKSAKSKLETGKTHFRSSEFRFALEAFNHAHLLDSSDLETRKWRTRTQDILKRRKNIIHKTISKFFKASKHTKEHTKVAPWENEILTKLKTKVSFKYKNAPLRKVLDYLSDKSGASIIIDPMVTAKEASLSAISLKVSKMEIRTALKLVMYSANLNYTLKHHAILITTPETLLLSNVALEIYDIGDLTDHTNEFVGPEISPNPVQFILKDGSVRTLTSKMRSKIKVDPLNIEIMMRAQCLEANLIDANASIEAQDGKLIAMTVPEVHKIISTVLKEIRKAFQDQAAKITPKSKPELIENGASSKSED